MKEKLFKIKTIGQSIGAFLFLLLWSFNSNAQCMADAAAIEITGTGATAATICAGDGVGDPIDVSVVGTGVGTNSGWVITDNSTGTILALPPAPPFDLDGAGDGICDIWYIRYEDGLTGLMTGQNVSGLSGCFDLSNPISVTRNDPDAAAIEITGTGATAATICAGDGVGDPIDVTLVGTGVGANSGWVITDNATGEILALPPAPPFDLDGAGDGVCDIWYIRYEDGLTGLMTGQNVSGLSGCFDLSNPISVTRNDPDAAAIEITGSGATEATICAGDGVGDPIDVSVVGTGVGANSGWVITDNATGQILALPPAPPFDLDGAGDGVCDIWYIRYEDGLTGLMTGQNVSGLSGCFDLSNPISVTRNDPDAAAIEITGTGATAATICAGDGVGDPIDVSLVGTGVGANSGWVITDNATGQILALPPAPPFDLDGAGDGICDIWYIRYEDGLTGLMTGQNVSGLSGCFDLSNPISVTRNDPDAAAIEITGTGATAATICAGDGVGDPIDVTLVGTGVGANSGWVITDNATGEILALPPAPPFDLDGAGDGICDIWYIRYEDGLTGLMTGQNVSGLSGCFDLSNPISVTRNDPDAAAIEITGTGATEATICAGDSVGDPIDVSVVGTGVGANSGWVITDNATGEILALPPAPPFDLDGAGDGVCDIWYIRYEDGLTGLMTGQNVSGLSGCFDLSNPISVTRNDPDAAAIEITGTGATAATICAGDGVGDPIDVTLVGTGVGANSGWVITDNATGEILALPPAPPFDLDGAGDGVCDIWYIRYEDGLTGLMTGQNVSGLSGCFDLSNPISVTRNDPDAAAIEITGSGATELEICAGDGVGDPIDVTLVGTGVGANSGWVITDNATGEILALPPAPPFDLDGAGDGVCDIWYIRYEDGLTGLMTGQNVSGLSGCFDLSNPISVTRNDPDAAAIEITGSGATEIEICAGDGVGDPIDVTLVGTGVGANSGWVITDQATGDILALPPAPPFDLEGAGDGVCDIWYIRYEDGLTGLTVGQNVSGLTGCFDLSNPISVDRQGVDAAAIEITGSGATAIDICAGDGIGDPIDVTIVGTGVGSNNGWVITDQATGTILALPAGPPFDLEGAGDGVCDIWYIRYEDGLTGLSTGQNVADLSGCFDLSNPISVNREGVGAPPIFITGSPGNTEITICAGDGIDNPINITIDGMGVGDNSGWVITDNATGDILALPAAPPFNLEGAGPGVCDIWYIRYATGLSGLAVGENVANLDGCFDLSNPVQVNRLGVDAAAIEITGSGGATEIDICAGDGIDDPIDVTLVGTGEGSFNGWVITDNATGEILALPPAPPFNLEGAGAGVCDIWYIRYESGLIGLNVGEDVANLTGCFDLSNPIRVNREGVDGAAIQIAGTTDTEVSICAGDGIGDPIDVEIVGTGIGANNGWVITDNATGEILALPPAPPFDLEGAGDGVCDIWYIRYADGLTGLETGQNVADLDGCFDLSNPIRVTRLTGDDCDILSTDEFQNTFEFALFPNPADNRVNISFLGGQSVNAEVAVYDITGRLVAQNKFNAQSEVSLDVTSLNTGTYLVQIQDSETGNSTTKQLIKR